MDALVSVVMLGGRVAGVLSNNTQNRAMDNAAQNLNESNAGARRRVTGGGIAGKFARFLEGIISPRRCRASAGDGISAAEIATEASGAERVAEYLADC
ncbi:hypothetical protein D3C71_304950 [compost metagenome]